MRRQEPDVQAAEREMLDGVLDYHRATMLWKCEGLTGEQLAAKTPTSDLTLGGLLKHLALVEDHWFRGILLGAEPAQAWMDRDWDADPDWDFTSAAEDSVEELLGMYKQACAASRDATASIDSLDALSTRTTRRTARHFRLRWIYLHMIEETARHNGHADLLREAIDGSTGE